MTLRIAIVDDHELVRTGLRMRLEHEEAFTVVGEAGTAAAAYALVEKESPDLVVMDLDLPGEDGLAATATLKTRWPGTRVLVLTGSKSDCITKTAIRAGADGIVFKSEASDDLVRAVRTLAAGKVFLSPDAATALVDGIRNGTDSTPARSVAGPELSGRERAVLQGLGEGLSYKEIAAQMGVSVKTVDTYRARLGKKLGCGNRAELVRGAIRLGLVQA